LKEGEQEAVVNAQRSLWESVTEREEFVGRLSFGSLLPQYLITLKLMSVSYEREKESTAMLTGAVVVDW